MSNRNENTLRIHMDTSSHFTILGLVVLLSTALISACSLWAPTPANILVKIPTVKIVAQASAVYEKTRCFVDLPQDVVEGKDVVCGYVTVPQYHADPNSKKLRLAVTITKSTNPHPDPVPLVMANGGPGGASIPLFLPLSLQERMADIRAQRDIIVVDYRGTGFSQPSFSCALYDHLDSFMNGETTLRTCLDNLTWQGYEISAFNSVEIAADYPAVLTALGYKQFHFYGVSYGTEIGQYLMREASGSLRSVVLDSILPLNVNFRLTVPNTADRDLRMIFKSCAADRACQQAHPNLEKTFLDLVDTLNKTPAMVSVDGSDNNTVPLDGNLLVDVLFEDLYNGSFIPKVPELITTMTKGDYKVIQPLVSKYLAGDPTMAAGLYATAGCAEYPDPTPADYNLRGLYPQVANALIDTTPMCHVARVKPLDISVHQPVVSDIPVLALSGAFDPITPPAFADAAIAKMSHAYHYTFPAEGHGVIFNACALSMITNFVADPQQQPKASCFLQQKPPAFGNTITLIPYIDKHQGFSTVIPNSWNEDPFGNFYDFDATRRIGFAVSPGTITINDVLSKFGMDVSQEKVVVGERVSHDMTWKLVRVQGMPTAYVALATKNGSSYAIMASALPQDIDALAKDFFYPAIDAFQVDDTLCYLRQPGMSNGTKIETLVYQTCL